MPIRIRTTCIPIVIYLFFFLPTLIHSADDRPVSTALNLHVHSSSLVTRNRIFINLWCPNAENVEVTCIKFIAMYSLQNYAPITMMMSAILFWSV